MRRPPLGNAVGSKGTRISSCSGKGKPAREAGRASPATCFYRMLKRYGKLVGISVDRIGPRAARATAATNALDQGADTAKVREWLGHVNVSTSRVYDHRKTKPEDSPTFEVSY